ncbi:hypothetical protein ACFO5R_01940 [Halosolutus amylolyticus]|uniref:DUF7847 domain-containing protein n=1 Tax=Halosolutus amylolyticus TaxID=2932267 RepID=A0ABD5PJQ0_9EURY|nr:hypothetical protein [Halosolutus amylolyticus]
MVVLAAFRDGWTALRKNPTLLLAGFAVAIVSRLQRTGTLTDSAVVDGLASITFFVAFPFVTGGFIGMALEAVRESETSIRRFVRAGRAHYRRMLGATVLFTAVAMAVVFGGLSIVTIGGVVWLFSVETVGETVAFATMAGFVGAYLLTIVLVLTFVQFYDAAVVVEGAGTTGALSRSVDVVRSNLPGALVFSVLWLVLLNTVLQPSAMVEAVESLSIAATAAGPADPRAIAAGTVAIDLGVAPAIAQPIGVAVPAVTGAYLYTVYTAFYVRLVAEMADSSPAAASTGVSG